MGFHLRHRFLLPPQRPFGIDNPLDVSHQIQAGLDALVPPKHLPAVPVDARAYPLIEFQAISYYLEPKKKKKLDSLGQANLKLIKYFDRLGIPLNEQKRIANIAIDAVLDNMSIATTYQKTLEAAGVIFCSISKVIREYPELILLHPQGYQMPPGYIEVFSDQCAQDGSVYF